MMSEEELIFKSGFLNGTSVTFFGFSLFSILLTNLTTGIYFGCIGLLFRIWMELNEKKIDRLYYN